MQPRLRLVPVEGEVASSDEAQMAALFERIVRTQGFTELNLIVTREVERVAKAHRSDLIRQGWIA